MKQLIQPVKNLVKVGEYVHTTPHALYNEPYKLYIKKRAKLAEKALAFFKTRMDLYTSQRVIIKPASRVASNAAFTLQTALISIKPNLTPYNFTSALAHECVHAEQFKRGDIYDAGDDGVGWKGAIYDYQSVLKYGTYGDYVNLPWEKEAYARQRGLADEFVRSLHWRDYDELFGCW